MMSSPYLKGSPVLVLLKSILDFSIYLNLCLIVTWISCFVLQSLSRTGSWLNSIPEIGIYTQLSLFPLEVERCWNILTEMSLPKLLIEVLLGIDGTPELSSSVCMHLSHTSSSTSIHHHPCMLFPIHCTPTMVSPCLSQRRINYTCQTLSFGSSVALARTSLFSWDGFKDSLLGAGGSIENK